MLTTLRVKNLALVESIRVDFRPGLNMITGETGAGKSILIGALGLLLGDRADKTLIRAGEEACGADAVFHLQDPSAIDAVLEEYGLDPCEDGQLVIRRVVRATGTSQILVNDNPVTLQVLKRVGDLLVDMHGPHDHQSLLRPESQLDILDAFGHLWDERAAYEDAYRQMRALEERKLALAANDRDVAEQIDLLSYRVKEIEDANLNPDEEEKISREHLVIGNAQRILELAGGVLGELTEGEASIFDRLAATRPALDELSRLLPEAEPWREEVQNLARQIQELGAVLSSAVHDVEGEPVRLEWLDQRLATYDRLKKKYGPTVEDVIQNLTNSRARLQDLRTRGEQIASIESELAEVGKTLQSSGMNLRKKRKTVAARLAKSVTKELRTLGFEHGSFAVDLEKSDPAASGIDRIEFGFAPNVGEPMRPLRAIASSGEISRVMLATKAVLADHDRIPILVFDEIDANLGGEMGHAVGRKLSGVSTNHQVICITHLPQVAVFGDTHFAVAKTVRDQRTFTEVLHLDEEDSRVRELARMLGGEALTPVTIDHAREMLQGV